MSIRSFQQLFSCFIPFSRKADIEAVTDAIDLNNKRKLEEALDRIGGRPFKIKARLLNPRNLSSDFYHEMTPAMFIIETGKLSLLKILCSRGYDLDRPQLSRRWRINRPKPMRVNFPPHKRVWTKGEYTYQSALDYFFGYVFERVGEFKQLGEDFESTYNLMGQYRMLKKIDKLLSFGIDVHRIDSIIVFDNLGSSFDYSITHNFDPYEPYFPEFSKYAVEDIYELKVLDSLIKHGFSEFEFLEYLNPNTNIFGLVFLMVAHPAIKKYCTESEEPLPEILQTAARILVNLLVWRYHLPKDSNNFNECAKNLDYSRRLFRNFTTRLYSRINMLEAECLAMVNSPPSLSLLARNRIRKHLGGKDFQKKVAALGLPQKLADFVISIGPEHMQWIRAPPYVISVARGRLEPSQIQEEGEEYQSEAEGSSFSDRDTTYRLPMHFPYSIRRRRFSERRYRPRLHSGAIQTPFNFHPSSPSVTSSSSNSSLAPSSSSSSTGSEDPDPVHLKRRASACSRTSRSQIASGPVLGIQRSMTTLDRHSRPTSAPIGKVSTPNQPVGTLFPMP